MGLETGTTIAALNAAWPLGSDLRSQGDDHLRLVKSVVKTDVASKALTSLQTYAGPLRIGDVYVGASHAGTVDPNQVAVATGEQFVLGAGTDVGTLFSLRRANATVVATFTVEGTGAPTAQSVITREKGDARYVALENTATYSVNVATGTVHMFKVNDVEAARINVNGTASPNGTTVITREKGDLRYAPKVLLLSALQALADSAPVAELRDALIGALTAVISDPPPPADA
jgi:hypothetical protein